MGPIAYALIVILVLFGYVIFLHIQLSRKNVFIETTVKRLSGIEKSRSLEEMITFLREIQKLSQYSSLFQDKFQDESVTEFIAGNSNENRTYMHYTRREEDARSIINNGFRFTDSFYKTALPVTNDKLDLTIKHNSRKYFGDYLIVISIDAEIVKKYSAAIEKAGIKEYCFENILTESPPQKNGNSDFTFQLAPQFIKGYVNHITGEIVKNPAFNPGYNSPAFLKNIELLRAG